MNGHSRLGSLENLGIPPEFTLILEKRCSIGPGNFRNLFPRETAHQIHNHMKNSLNFFTVCN